VGWRGRLPRLRKMPRISGRHLRSLRYNAPDAGRLRTHYEDLSTELESRNIDRRIPWLNGFERFGFRLDFGPLSGRCKKS
jgi:hypothetical protein